MNALSWALYAADALGSLKALLIILAVVFGPLYLILTAIQRSDECSFGKAWPWPKRAVPVSVFLAVAGCALPWPQTVYLIAASEVGERVANSPEGRDMLELIRHKIRDALASKT